MGDDVQAAAQAGAVEPTSPPDVTTAAAAAAGPAARLGPAGGEASGEAPAARGGPRTHDDDVRLTRGQAERVISRALHLQDDRGHPADEGLSIADVREVAREIGLDPALVGRALAEVRVQAVAEVEPSATERLLGPRTIAGATVVDADADTVRDAARRWMAQDEGMRLAAARAQADRWVKDRRLITEVKHGLHVARGEGVLRDLKGVEVAVDDEGGDAVVAITADTSTIRASAGVISAVGVLGGAAVGVAQAAMIPDTAVISGDLAQFLLSWGVWSAAGVGTAVTVARAWSRRVREAIDATLDGIAMTATVPDARTATPARPGWRGVVDRVLGGGGA